MTQDNYSYRTRLLFLRNQFMGKGILKMPNVPKSELSKEDLDGLRLIAFNKF